ncbi:MAG: sugar phosphate isomerase/epimerase [Bacteroidia bacterium]|nr:sugar phosphate isomerase/epimerase [Bacteroidia bacterium]
MSKKLMITALILIPMLFSCTSKNESGSKFGGVQIGAITYSWRSMPGGVENIIKYCKEAGITSIELMSNDVEEYLGAPKNPLMGMFGPRPGAQPPAGAAPAPGVPPAGPPAPGPGAPVAGTPGPGAPPAGGPPAGFRPRFEITPEMQAEIDKYNLEMKTWRLSLPMSKFEEVRKMFSDAGISIPIVKFSPARWSDEEIDYAFNAAKALGAKGVSEEIGEEAVKKLGPIAEKHGMYAIFHNHMQFAEPGFSYDPFIAVSPAVMFNFDAGHFYGSTGLHPNTIIEKYHERIFSIHLKDKTGPNTIPANENQVWGKVEVPIEDVLLLIQENKWPIYCDIELEYDVKPWSNAVKETKTCVKYARQILLQD